MRHARVVWMNWPYWVELGFPLPPHGLTAPLEQLLLDAFAWRTVDADDAPDAFTRAPARRFWADRYGGQGAEPNLGSGRAACRGVIQLKGSGATSLVHARTNQAHRNGALPLGEALREALWGELNHHEAAHGANRVLAVIDCARTFVTAEGMTVRRALVVRPFPLRPSHFIPNLSGWWSAPAFRRQVARLSSLLPRADGEPASLGAGLRELLRRAGAQEGTLLARRLPHGSLNASNLELSGKLLDFGSQSAQPGHGPTRGFPRWSNAVGLGFAESLLALITTVAAAGTERDTRALPEGVELKRLFDLSRGRALLHELLGLAGVVGVKMRQSEDDTGMALAFAIQKLAFLPAETVELCHVAPDWTGRYDVGRILFALACLARGGERLALKRLEVSAHAVELRELISAYFAHRRSVARRTPWGLRPAHFDELIRRVAAFRNWDRPQLAQTTLRAAYEAHVDTFAVTGDLQALSRAVDHDITEGRRFFTSTRTGEVLLREWVDRSTLGTSRVAYVHRGGGYRLELDFAAQEGDVSFFGSQGPPRLELRFLNDDGVVASPELRWSRGAQRIQVRCQVPREATRAEVWLSDQRVLGLVLLPPLYTKGVDRIERAHFLKRPVTGFER